jgi:polysaccharide biosynthesis/export protein
MYNKIAACFSVLLSIFASVLVVGGQSSGGPTQSDPIPAENYRIGPGDVLDIVVSKNDTLSRTGLKVTNLGTIQLPMLDSDLPAACKTERQLANEIKEKYRRFLVEPFVNVSVREYNANPVAVIGAVNTPGRFQLQRRIRLVELLTFVNGPSTNAGKTVEILRNLDRPYCDGLELIAPDGSGETLISVNLAEIFKGAGNPNPLMLPGDIVRVPEAALLNAYIQGSVRNGMAIPLKDPVTLTEAIAMAGGLVPGAQIEKIKIRRQVPDSLTRNDLLVNLKEIGQQKRDDVLIQPNDIIEVPGPSGLKKVFHDIYNTIVPTISSLPLRVVY